jgi:hypothetical protein
MAKPAGLMKFTNPFTGREQPEYKERKGDEPSQSGRVVNIVGCFESEQRESPVDLKTGDQQRNNQHRLQPLPVAFVAGIEIDINHIVFHGLFLLSAVRV